VGQFTVSLSEDLCYRICSATFFYSVFCHASTWKAAYVSDRLPLLIAVSKLSFPHYDSYHISVLVSMNRRIYAAIANHLLFFILIQPFLCTLFISSGARGGAVG